MAVLELHEGMCAKVVDHMLVITILIKFLLLLVAMHLFLVASYPPYFGCGTRNKIHGLHGRPNLLLVTVQLIDRVGTLKCTTTR